MNHPSKKEIMVYTRLKGRPLKLCLQLAGLDKNIFVTAPVVDGRHFWELWLKPTEDEASFQVELVYQLENLTRIVAVRFFFSDSQVGNEAGDEDTSLDLWLCKVDEEGPFVSGKLYRSDDIRKTKESIQDMLQALLAE